MVLQSQTSLQRIQESFDELCKNILADELCDNGRSIRRKGPLHGGMKLTLSPMETRHETAIRVIVGQVGALGVQIAKLERALEPQAATRKPAEGDDYVVGTDKADPLPTDTEQMFVDALETSEKPLTEE